MDKSKKNESNINVLNKEQYNNLVKKNEGVRFKNDSLSSRMTNTSNLSRLGGNLIVSQEKIPVNKLRQEKPAVVKITKTKPENPVKMQKQERKVSITSVPKINKSHPPRSKY